MRTLYLQMYQNHWSKDAIDYLAAAGLLTDMEMENLVLGIILLEAR